MSGKRFIFAVLFICFSLIVVSSGIVISDDGLQALNEVCFSKCHKKTDFNPASKSEAQWEALIGNNEHEIFAHIPWKSDAQKQAALNFLKAHSSDKQRAAEGIGVWQ